ncbi:hypothetical protein BDBG_16988 [Blastomyces gilchristii SLH14081]|uniref:Uncharacterized protein n=1 Tax=Blastomyces gilchristii (strain SLH14081) TaxID=559298 RepID=A0A179UM90_BLAGS|nr:uncharacterized protein BDBG_16988 [Blastomyces gilchristii SLH14081]OAT08257.1 hypothetical protein BDBG_16988 [Blastomyces gilchristii SLH14081]
MGRVFMGDMRVLTLKGNNGGKFGYDRRRTNPTSASAIKGLSMVRVYIS